MITVTKQENGVLFTFQDSDKYLYGSGTILVPFNSLSIIMDESDMITLRKSASNDIFLSARYDTDLGYGSKEEAVDALTDMLYDEAGISQKEVQDMIDAATSGIPSSEVTEQLRTDVNTLSGNTYSKSQIDGFLNTAEQVISTKADASALTEVRQDVNKKANVCYVDFIELYHDDADITIELWYKWVEALKNNAIFYASRTPADDGLRSEPLVVLTNPFDPANPDGMEYIKFYMHTDYGLQSANIVRTGENEFTVLTDAWTYEVDNQLNSGSTNPVQNAVITQALNNKLDASAYTPTDLSEYWTSGQTQNAINAATSGIPSSQVVEQLRTDINTVSGDVENKQDKLQFYGEDTEQWEESDGDNPDSTAVFTTKQSNIYMDFSGDEGSSVAGVETRIDAKMYNGVLDTGFSGSFVDIYANGASNDTEYASSISVNQKGVGINTSFIDTNDEFGERLASIDMNNNDVSISLESTANGDSTVMVINPSGVTINNERVLTEGDAQALDAKEEVIASALTELKSTKLDASAYTPTDLSEYWTSAQTQSAIDAATSGIPSSQVIEALRSDLNTVSGTVDTLSGAVIDNEYTVSQAINELKSTKLDASAYTPTDLSNYYTKTEVYNKQEVDAAYGTAYQALTAHTANTTVHVTSVEKDAWNAKANIDHVTQAEYSAMEQAGTLDSNTMYIIDDAVPFDPSTKVDVSAITSSITSGSTDSEIPTAKAVYDAIQAGGGGGSSTDTYVSGGTVGSNGVITLTKNDGTTASVTGLNTYVGNQIDIAKTATGGYDDSYVNVSGDTMTGALNIETANITGAAIALKDNDADILTIGRESGSAAAVITIPNGGITNGTDSAVWGNGVSRVLKITQAQYDALATKDSFTLYIVVD